MRKKHFDETKNMMRLVVGGKTYERLEEAARAKSMASADEYVTKLVLQAMGQKA